MAASTIAELVNKMPDQIIPDLVPVLVQVIPRLAALLSPFWFLFYFYYFFCDVEFMHGVGDLACGPSLCRRLAPRIPRHVRERAWALLKWSAMVVAMFPMPSRTSFPL